MTTSPAAGRPAPPPSTAKEVPDKGKWAVKPLNDGKSAYALPTEWKSGALHHKISKERLSSIAEQLAPAWNAKDSRLQGAARTFWNLCWAVAGESVAQAVAMAGHGGSPNPHRLLWNLPLMVSLGPQSPANDPGMNFDPDTEPVPGGAGTRRMDAVSIALKELETAWLTAADADGGRGVYDAALWTTLHRHLQTAHIAAERIQRGERVLYPPLREQWVYDATTKQNLRKGLTPFPTPEQGLRLFAGARSNAPSIAAYAASGAAAATATVRAAVGGRQVTLRLTAAEENVHHVCVRHTLTFFDFTDASRPRPVNTFWPDVRTFADTTALAAALLPGIGRSCLLELDRTLGNVAEAADWLDEVLEISNADVDGRLVFYNVQFTEVNGTDAAPAVEAVIESFAPDGSDGPGFTRGDLDLIAGRL
ncbi:hypothetical protein Snoj_31200 [Streptomyces nojiriensis]|uniref:Uncharacterized protein n=1 Tax=Streptomyces nojiriensis TaxID=66374 RepID=A0ABQ3SMB4_9ACTN|nr:hypothetical protein [Streptomyces nojiriensis]QTI42781.1 hypothetical protein JYK04_00540 [Streptomyces nojiriensis]GGS16815.1 hypothetical protein GCM10010205_53380 [Streptomyces nojiriensis]GHI69202.1 hypothetical protein Snoj_31200 [Streptomyces nojiriensis]